MRKMLKSRGMIAALAVLAGVLQGIANPIAIPAPRPEPPVVPPPVPPIVRPVNLRPDEKPVAVTEWTVDARVSGAFAVVKTMIVVGNPNGRDLEGAPEFPLPDGASVCGYALDVNGVLTDGVVVPKEKARVAFEAEVKAGVDPGLVEHLKGNAYRTRIYPIPRNGSRRLRVDYVAPLAFAPNGDAALVLTMPRTKLAERNVAITVPMGGGMPKPVLGGLGDNRFAEAEAVWRSVVTDRDVTPDADVTVALPALPESLVAVEKAGEEVWFAVSEKAPALDTAKTSLPTTWRILWDASGSRSAADVKAALAVVDELPGNACYELVLFRNAVEEPRICATRDELKSCLARVPYDGGTDLKALADMHRANRCENRTLLFTDGMDVLSDGEADFGANKPIAVVSGATKDCATLRRLCGGRVIDLAVRTPAQAVAEIADPPATVQGVEGRGFANIQGVGQAASGRVTVLGRLTADVGEVSLNYGYGRRSKPVQVHRADAREGATLAAAWASRRVDELSPRADDHAEELLALGRRYGRTSPATSLIVFERLDQWLKYDVEPPASATNLHANWVARRPSESQRAQEEERRAASHLERLKREWQERVSWWENPVPPKPKTPKSGLFEAAAAPFQTGAATYELRASLRSAARGGMRMRRASVNEDMEMAEASASGAMACAMAEPAPEPVRESGLRMKKSVSSPRSVAATVSVKAWDPQTPYLRAIKDARTALGTARDVAYGEYLVQRRKYAASPAFYLDCAGYFFSLKEDALAVRILSNLSELRIEDAGLLRTYAWRLKEAGAYDLALPVLRKVAKLRAEQPFSYRDLAIVLDERGRKNRSAADIAEALALYHKTAFTPWKVDSGLWTAVVAIEEFNALAAWSDRQSWPEGTKPAVPDCDAAFRKLLDMDVRIAMEWDVDNTDIDLHVLEPEGEEAYYGHRRTLAGGFVSHDVTTGYGPEEYLRKTGAKGDFKILVNYFASHQQSLLGPATVTATVFTNWGREKESRQTLSLRLEKSKDKFPVGTVTINP